MSRRFFSAGTRKLARRAPQRWHAKRAGNTPARVTREVLNEAVAAGGSSLRFHRKTDGALGYFQHSFRVYGRAGQPCAAVRQITQADRATFYCGGCQRWSEISGACATLAGWAPGEPSTTTLVPIGVFW